MELIGILIVCVFVAALWPVTVIWSLNTLFGLGIAFTVKTWFAAIVVMAVFARGRTATKK